MSSSSSETKKLLDDEGAKEAYGTEQPFEGDGPKPSRNPVVEFVMTHRTSIPGYGMLKMLKGSSLYSLYVLFILLMVYLTNQLDRYTLPIVTPSAGYDLHYGDIYCFKSRQVSSKLFKEYNITKNITDICGKKSYTFVDEFGENETVNVK